MAPDSCRAEAARFLGAGGAVPPELAARIDELYTILLEHALPRTVWKIFDVECTEDAVIFDGVFSIRGKSLAQHLRGCGRAVLLAATLGVGVDRLVARLQATAMDDAVVLNACAAAEIEALCDRAEVEIAGAAAGGFLTARYSPGYGDVPLSESQKILATLEAGKRTGVTLTRTNLLVPFKSVTAVIGISGEKREGGGGCPQCGLQESCPFRKRGGSCGL